MYHFAYSVIENDWNGMEIGKINQQLISVLVFVLTFVHNLLGMVHKLQNTDHKADVRYKIFVCI